MILGLDLGTKCGYSHPDESGVWDLSKPKAHSVIAARQINFHKLLESFLRNHTVHTIAYEYVRGHKGTLAAHVYGALEAKVHELAQVPVKRVTVQEVKKLATGKGNSPKSAVLAAAQERWPHVASFDEADACWVREAARLAMGLNNG